MYVRKLSHVQIKLFGVLLTHLRITLQRLNWSMTDLYNFVRWNWLIQSSLHVSKSNFRRAKLENSLPSYHLVHHVPTTFSFYIWMRKTCMFSNQLKMFFKCAFSSLILDYFTDLMIIKARRNKSVFNFNICLISNVH